MGHHHLLSHFHGHTHHHNHHHHRHHPSDVPKGCVAVRVGRDGGGEEPHRFVVPVGYLNHPLFLSLLKVAEDEYGFDQKGTFTLPCRVAEFQSVRGLIQQEINHYQHHQSHRHHRSNSCSGGSGAAAGHHLHLAGCFKAH